MARNANIAKQTHKIVKLSKPLVRSKRKSIEFAKKVAGHALETLKFESQFGQAQKNQSKI